MEKSIYNNIRNEDGIWVNSDIFRDSAKHFIKYGRYNDDLQSPDPHSDYQKFWVEEERRCIEGYKTGGAYITGDHYNYLNYSPIRLTQDEEDLKGVMKSGKKSFAAAKITNLPDFWDGDYDYFHTINIARWGIHPKILEKLKLGITIHPDDIYGGKHLCVAKARRKGFSYKNASLVVNRMKRVPESISVIAAFDSKFLYPKGTTAMADFYIDHMNKHTAWKRRKTIDRTDLQEDGYIIKVDGIEVTEGFQSSIISVSCQDNPDAIRGKDGTLILLEEGGKFPNILPTIDSTLPTLKDGIYVTGQMIAFGTGGGKNLNWEGFETIFYSPASYGFMRIHNDWDDGAKGSYCGYYFPDCLNKKGFIDKQGNSDKEGATEYQEDLRIDIKKDTKDPDRVRRHKMEEANKPSETFARAATNIFPIEELEEHLRVVNSQRLWRDGVPGVLRGSGEGIQFFPDYNKDPILVYPHKNVGDLSGCVVQYHPPFKLNGAIPPDLYSVCHDPYDFDKSQNQESLGCTYVMMNPNNIIPGFKGGDIIVASYIGRPISLDLYNETLFNLAIYYNAKIGYENDRGDVLGYAKRNKHLLGYLEPEFELGWSDGMNNNLGRGYGMSMGGGKDNKKVKTGDIFIRDWLNTIRFISEEEKRIVKTLHTIKDPGLLQELIMYGKGNFDRVSCLRIGMYYMKEFEYSNKVAGSKAKTSVSKFFKTKLCA
jgi:hypothetical protein